MKITVIRPHNLSPRDRATWMRLLRDEVGLCNPFLTPRFAELVDEARGGVAVGVMKSGNESVGFFPFQYLGRSRRVGQPVGWPMSDFQAIVAPNDLQITPEELLRGCGLKAFDFDHLIASQSWLEAHHVDTQPSPYLDLSNGFEAYRAERRAAGSNRIKSIDRKQRKLVREHGEVQYLPNEIDEDLFQTLIRWKSDQFERTNIFNLFQWPWTVSLLQTVLKENSRELTGRMSVLRLNGRPIAVDLGMQTEDVLHSWFPSYDRSYRSYCPGHMLTIQIARSCDELGFGRFELGKGPEEYKASFASGSIAVAEGGVDLRPVLSAFRRNWKLVKTQARTMRIAQPLRMPVRYARKLKRSLASF
ncbi:GNAT family N-acetyltransferase [Stratiformator vulcanicus]|uniref:BioF2-like acetyltransferase domain-containing protein n=1 Tax=Stratiformator vulcanicus TaxID=2527980 RepID=A0A517R424_9PLAN|nr:GNAT family N-acetyltransferase [Stratiformator vulcanicus]QDT38634.1 hypothetical protein Pan189_30290 [Stratiformator vulcanicus]